MIKVMKELGIEESYLNIIKAIHNKLTTNIVLNGEKLEGFPLKSGIRQRHPLSSLLFSMVFELARAIM
jgi:hypothetical protein